MGAPRKSIGLSKSRVLRGLQCVKNLYLSVHHPELEPPVSESQQATFDRGHEVGCEAQRRFPGGVLIDTGYRDMAKAAKLTAEAIKAGKNTIFEATFIEGDVGVRVDVLHREDKRKAWKLIEVKSSTKVKPEHLPDVAVQTLVLKQAGLKVGDKILMHINNKCTAPDLKNLFKQQVISDEIEPHLSELPEKMKELRKILMQPKPPQVPIGPQCDSPYECGFKEHCWRQAKMPTPSVFDFPGIASKGWKYVEMGVKRLDDPGFGPFKDVQARRLQAVRSGKRWVDSAAIARQLKAWKWPLYFFDFETISYAIPVYDGTRPYQNIPFQFSCFEWRGLNAKPKHSEYLHNDASDPRLPLIKALLLALGSKGSIVSYNKSFEAKCLEELAEAYPQYGKKLSTFVDRLVDPQPIFRSAVYDAKFLGSFSIKAVGPAILGAQYGYADMAVGDGEAAQRAFLEMTSSKTVPQRKAQVRKDLLSYCKQDTEVMLRLVEWLYEQVRKN